MMVLLTWCLFLLLAWGLWLWRLDASDLTFDEAATYFVAHRPVMGILDYLRGAVREHPPVYYLLIHAWMGLAGTSEFSLRFFSVGAALVALVLTGWLARIGLGRSASGAGLVPAVLLASVPGMAYFARDARMYSLGVAWTVLAAGLFLRDWLPAKGWPRPFALAILVAVHILALFTHYYLLLPILVQPLALLVTRRWRPLLAWCATHGLLVLLGLTWLWLAPGLQMTTGGTWPRLTFVVPARFYTFHMLGKMLFSPVVRVRFSLLYWLLALAGVGMLLALWRKRQVGIWLALVLLLPPVLVFQVPHPPAERYLLFLIPFTALAMGFLSVLPLLKKPGSAASGEVEAPSLTQKPGLWAWGLAAGLTVGLAGLLAAGGLDQALAFDRSHYSHTLKTIKAQARPGDGVLFYGPWQWIQFQYYDPGGLPPITTLPPYAPPRLKPAEAEPVLEELLACYDRLWVIPAAVDDVDPPRFVAGWLRINAHLVWDTVDFNLYLPALPPDAPARPVEVVFGERLRLASVAWEPQAVPAGDPLRLTLHWSPLRSLDHDVRLALQLADATGYVWAQAETLPGAWAHPPSQWEPGELVTDREGLIVPQGAPPGEYTLRLMVTDAVTGEPLLAEGPGEVDVLTVQVGEPAHAPVLYGLSNSGTATFCSPDGADCLTLAGVEPGGVRFQQGYAVPLTLHWLVPGEYTRLPEVQVHLQVSHRSWLGSQQATPMITRTFPLPSGYATAPLNPPSGGQSRPFRIMLPFVARAAPWGLQASSAPEWTSARRSGRLVTTHAALVLPPDAPTGPAQVTLAVLGPDGALWSAFRIPKAEGGGTIPLFGITVDSRPVLRRPPGGLIPIQLDFGDEVGLRGYRVEGDARPGGQLSLVYTWYARTRPTAIYAVFNHLVDADGTLVAQADGWPQEGRMLSIQWRSGEYIEDSYALAIPPDAPPGPYTLYVGLYNAANAERQPAFLDGQRLPADQLPISLNGAR